MKKVLISETQKDAIDKQFAANVVVAILATFTLFASKGLQVITEAKEQGASQLDN